MLGRDVACKPGPAPNGGSRGYVDNRPTLTFDHTLQHMFQTEKNTSHIHLHHAIKDIVRIRIDPGNDPFHASVVCEHRDRTEIGLGVPDVSHCICAARHISPKEGGSPAAGYYRASSFGPEFLTDIHDSNGDPYRRYF